MQSIGDILKATLGRSDAAKPYFERSLEVSHAFSPGEHERIRADRYNQTAGNLNADGSYDCKLCKNRGNFAEATERNGMIYQTIYPCKCMEIRQSIWRMRASGLENAIRQCTFERFAVRYDWQQKMLDTAKSYIAEGAEAGKWLFMGGAVGSGKTHICTAVCRTLLYAGKSVYYMPWQSESTKLKAIISDDEEEYSRTINRLKNVSVLYIDDFFKPVIGDRGTMPPTPADVKLAYEVLNYRYVNRSPTIISSERYLSELMDIDEALASRIYERANGYALSLGRNRDKNHRITGDNLL